MMHQTQLPKKHLTADKIIGVGNLLKQKMALLFDLFLYGMATEPILYKKLIGVNPMHLKHQDSL